MSPQQHLRAATRAAHDRVDAGFSSLDLANPVDYRRFLLAHAAAFVPIEAALTTVGAARLVPDWDAQRRSDALIADLATLGLDPPRPETAPDYADDAAIIGGLYVLEGSRLGGQMLKRQLASGQPRGFLDAPQPAGRWRSIVAIIDQRLDGAAELAAATSASLQTFAVFELAGKWA